MPRFFGGQEIIFIIIIVLLIFGPKRIAKMAGELGKGIKAFRDGITGEEKDDTPANDDE